MTKMIPHDAVIKITGLGFDLEFGPGDTARIGSNPPIKRPDEIKSQLSSQLFECLESLDETADAHEYKNKGDLRWAALCLDRFVGANRALPKKMLSDLAPGTRIEANGSEFIVMDSRAGYSGAKALNKEYPNDMGWEWLYHVRYNTPWVLSADTEYKIVDTKE